MTTMTCSQYKETAEGVGGGLVGAEACSALADGRFGLAIDCVEECRDCCEEDPCDRKCEIPGGEPFGGMECRALFRIATDSRLRI